MADAAVDAAVVAVKDNSTLVALERAQIDQQISTAKAYPRSIQSFKDSVLSFATLDQETAEAMTYVLPGRSQDGKLIEGPSVRLAEIAGSCWGNVRYGARVIEIGDQFLTARGMCYDLERNIAIEIDVKRSITGRNGRFNNNLIQVVGQAACAIALRNAIFKVIPMALIKPAWEQAKRVAAGEAKTLGARLEAALAWFKENGIKQEQVFGFLGVSGKGDVTLTHLQQMQAIRTSVKDGEAAIEDFFKKTVIVTDDVAPIIEATLVSAADDPKSNPKKDPEPPAVEAKPEPEPETKAEPSSKGKGKQRTKADDDLDKLFQ
jgi:hypothetical protein